MSVPTAASPRIDWDKVPRPVRDAVEGELGAPVVTAVTQVGGFSPGAAARVQLADGRRAFVKACGSELNPESPELHRREIRALGLLPPEVPAPALLGAYDDNDWVAMVLEDVEGHRPGVPWSVDDLAATAAAVERTAMSTQGALPAFAEIVLALTAWDDIAADHAGIDPRLVARMPEMLEHQTTARAVTRGEALVHWDVRHDNVLVRPTGEAVLVDWAWACRGAPWLDTLMIGMDLVMFGGPDPGTFVRSAPLTRDVPRDHLRALIASLVGVWAERARRPAPPGLPTIRSWQAYCAAAALAWLDDRSAWG